MKLVSSRRTESRKSENKKGSAVDICSYALNTCGLSSGEQDGALNIGILQLYHRSSSI